MARIVVGVDGTQQSREAVAWAVRHATGGRDSVQAIMTVPTEGLAEPERLGRLLDAQDTLAEVVEAGTLAAGTTPSRLSRSVVEGDPAAVLVESTRGADLLVLASHHMATLSNPGLSTVSVACIRDGSCPVLVLPSGPPEQMEPAALVPTGTAA